MEFKQNTTAKQMTQFLIVLCILAADNQIFHTEEAASFRLNKPNKAHLNDILSVTITTDFPVRLLVI